MPIKFAPTAFIRSGGSSRCIQKLHVKILNVKDNNNVRWLKHINIYIYIWVCIGKLAAEIIVNALHVTQPYVTVCQAVSSVEGNFQEMLEY